MFRSGHYPSIRLRDPETDSLILAKMVTADPSIARVEHGQTPWRPLPPSASRILPRESQSEV